MPFPLCWSMLIFPSRANPHKGTWVRLLPPKALANMASLVHSLTSTCHNCQVVLVAWGISFGDWTLQALIQLQSPLLESSLSPPSPNSHWPYRQEGIHIGLNLSQLRRTRWQSFIRCTIVWTSVRKKQQINLPPTPPIDQIQSPHCLGYGVLPKSLSI